MASAWYAQHRRLKTGERFGALDRHLLIPEPFPMALYFPDTFTTVTEEDIDRLQLPQWDQTVLWLNATNEFARNPADGFFEHVPESILSAARRLEEGKTAGRPMVLMHVLDDAAYNHKRNWRRADALAVARALEKEGCEVSLLNPEQGKFVGGYQDMMAKMLAADAFIGGDTGPSHLFAQLCPDKPQVAVYPDMTEDQANYRQLQEAQALPLPWNSLPKKRKLAHITLVCARATTWSGFWIKQRKYQRFYPADVLRALLPQLKPGR
ncbi:MAG: hypothetical protein GAK35_00801 [Herbaspirillum frisingense]|uniref:Glycosyltransferase family 9 protein n=1 Tax=Herbaspirillum frisingense TaxID=92645 RepID=A0A7V8FZ75_9BURK|nr:MAG: hypothetical protein GAK35_00801 [Herbaspirillum frisingense]